MKGIVFTGSLFFSSIITSVSITYVTIVPSSVGKKERETEEKTDGNQLHRPLEVYAMKIDDPVEKQS